MQIKCSYCHKMIECRRSLSGHLAKCRIWRDLRSTLLSEEYLRREYVKNEKSLPDISVELGVSFRSIQNALRKLGIPIRDRSEASLTERCQQKHISANMKSGGQPHNFCKDHPSRKKWEEKLLQEEGITNVFQRESVKRKSVETLLRKYQVERPWLTPNSTVVRGPITYSRIHREVVKFLQDNQLVVSVEYKLDAKLWRNRNYLSFDIWLDGTNKLIEVYGNYWHGNPLVYTESDIILKGSSGEKRVGDKWAQDREKNALALSRGMCVLVIWEQAWTKDLTKTQEKIMMFVQRESTNENFEDQINQEVDS